MTPKLACTSILLFLTIPACAETPPGISLPVAGSPAAATGVADRPGEAVPNATMLRYPDISATHIVFVYANDLWLVSRDGGLATPLASPPGVERHPRFSRDGKTIAFVGNYDGNQDLYTIPVAGGRPTRVTHHPADETLCDWAPDGKLIFFSNATADMRRMQQLVTVPPNGGLPTRLPVPYGANGTISDDGTWLAYTPHSRDERSWKRYRGGMATDIWVFNLRDHSSKKITDWEGTDSQPMWQGRDVYYLSDAGQEHRLNIWRWESDSGKNSQITRFADFDVKWPNNGPGPNGEGEIVFQLGDSLRVLDLATGESAPIAVRVPGDRPRVRPRIVDASKVRHSVNVSPRGKRALIGARGDIWSIPAEKGSPRNLTRTSGVAERDPSWSPDGRWIAYFCDAGGEYELYMMQSDGRGEIRQLTNDGAKFRHDPTWSPDSAHLAYADDAGSIYIHTIDRSKTVKVDTDPWADRSRVSWAPDSRWLAYCKSADNYLSAIWLYNLETGKTRQVTSGRFNDTWPTFDRKGDYLFFASNRKFSSALFGDIDGGFVYAGTDILLVVPLRAEVGSPFAAESDEETWGKDREDEEDDEATSKPAEDDEDKKIEPVEIELDGFERRAVAIPVNKGAFGGLAVNHEGKLLYVRGVPRGADGKSSIKIFDLEDDEREEATVVEDAGGFLPSADGKKILVFKDQTLSIVDAEKDQKLEKTLTMKGFSVTIDPRAEWQQMFREVWRIYRDLFYAHNMHGVDWEAVGKRYGAMVEDCASREDLSYLMAEMVAELNVGHAYVYQNTGDVDPAPAMSVGMLGVDYELHDGAYRIAKIHSGAPWDVDARGPLGEPGLDVSEGDYLLAVNGVPVNTGRDPWAAFAGMAGKVISLTVSEKPRIDDDARQIVVKALASEMGLRYRSWVEKNRAYVERKSGGRVAYVHVPDTAGNGQNELFRQFFGQIDKDAMIVDERWNGGGYIPLGIIELLNRPVRNYWAWHHGRDTVSPRAAHHGPKCMLINGMSGSGGDCFPYYFRQAMLGKLIGTRTWGGLVGISGNPMLIDGGIVFVPTFGFFETDGTWGVEGHGVDPDIEVVDDPSLMTEGGDPQLDAAIASMLGELERNPYVKPDRPPYPDRAGMGIAATDK